MRERLEEELWWTLNLAVRRVSDGRILGREVGRSFQVIPDSGMIYGVGIWPKRKPFHIYMVLLAQNMLLLQLT
jgi:hypothetical protein